jgi:hypothetical protein
VNRLSHPFQALLAPRSPKTSNKNRNKRSSYPLLSTAFAHFPNWESPICNIPNDLRTLVKTPGGVYTKRLPNFAADVRKIQYQPDSGRHTHAREQRRIAMPRNQWVHKLTVATTIAACVTGACLSARTKEPPMLSADSFAKAKDFINRTGRPVERARLRFHFEHGSAGEVIAELTKFQNPDGGFATYLESDSRWTGSSPNGTRVALKILTEVKAPAQDPHVQAAVKYLAANFDERAGAWRALPREANAAPHAPWWHVHEDTGKCDVDSPIFPTAALAGYLQPYNALLPDGFLNRITDSSLKYLADAPVKMEMSDIDMLTELVRLLPPGQSQREAAIQKLRTVLNTVVVRDPREWTTYGIQPLSFVDSLNSPFYPGLEREVDANLDYILTTQKDDGGWPLNWSWSDSDPAAWKIAEQEWRAVMTLEKLERLEGFHRIRH